MIAGFICSERCFKTNHPVSVFLIHSEREHSDPECIVLYQTGNLLIANQDKIKHNRGIVLYPEWIQQGKVM